MPDHHHVKISGRISDVFAHRFVIEADEGNILADIGPKGAAIFTLKRGTNIMAEGEMKPSELKVTRIARAGETPVMIEHKKKHDPHHPVGHETEANVRAAVEQAGFETIGAVRHKARHFEVLGRRAGAFIECHVEFDGHILKEKPVDPNDKKWVSDLRNAA